MLHLPSAGPPLAHQLGRQRLYEHAAIGARPPLRNEPVRHCSGRGAARIGAHAPGQLQPAYGGAGLRHSPAVANLGSAQTIGRFPYLCR